MFSYLNSLSNSKQNEKKNLKSVEKNSYVDWFDFYSDLKFFPK